MQNLLGRLALAISAILLTATPASAQTELEIAPDAAWTHPHSGIVVPATLGGVQRTRAFDFATDFLSTGFTFLDDAGVEILSLYIYRNTNGAVPVWFEQARRGIEGRDIYRDPQLAFAVESYGWPGEPGWQGQRAIYATPDSPDATSTGLALFSINGWYVKLRATSLSRTPEQMMQWIDTALSEVVVPSNSAPQPPLMEIEDCAEPLTFKKARDAKDDGAASILSSLLGGLIAQEVAKSDEPQESKEAVIWCRDSSLNRMQSAYRANASTDSYLIALNDAGMGVSVAPDQLGALLSEADGKQDTRFSIAVILEDQRINFVPQDRLPSLKRVLEIINDNRRVGSVSTWGDDSTVEINSDAM